MKNDSDKVVLNAVKGMLPKNKLGREISKHESIKILITVTKHSNLKNGVN